MKKISLLLCLLVLLTACPMDRGACIHVKNNSNQTIVVTAEYILPDTLWPKQPLFLTTINSNQSRIIYDSDVNDGYLQRMEKGERLTLFVLSKDSVNSHSWEYLRENNVILKRYEFNADELDKMGQPITYP